MVKCQSAIILLCSYVLQPFNFQRWLTCKFSLKYPHIIQQTSSEITQTYQVQDFILIAPQILKTNLQGNVWQLEERINNQILGVEGLLVGLWVVLPFQWSLAGKSKKIRKKFVKNWCLHAMRNSGNWGAGKEVHFMRLNPRVFQGQVAWIFLTCIKDFSK